MKRLTATIHGRVQGVGFRWFVTRHAARLQLSGWVANDPEGTVSLVAEGSEQEIAELLELVRQGPAGAEVTTVASQLSAGDGTFTGFRVRAAGHGGD